MGQSVTDSEELPGALTARDQWVCWRREERDRKATKVPVDASTGSLASTTDPATWTSVEDALRHESNSDVTGIGFVFTEDDPFVGVDLDDCRDPDTGAIDDWARDVVLRLDSYSEVSPSGTGVHVIAEGELPDGRSRSGNIEMYETSRYFTVTGDHLDQTPMEVCRRSDVLRSVHEDHVGTELETGDDRDLSDSSVSDPRDADLDDAELLERARSAENGDHFDALWRGQTTGYPSQSEADMALCLHLAFWTGGDRNRMDRLFRRSGLMREKWDEVHYADGTTYGERTIERALETVEEVYEPDRDLEQRTPLPQLWETGSEFGPEPRHQPTGSADYGESVYLEERNRLLREKIHSQKTTIERQRDRIDELERELDALQAELTLRAQTSDGETDELNRWIRLKQWIGNS